MNIKIPDCGSIPISDHFTVINKFIYEVLQPTNSAHSVDTQKIYNNNKILVHCYAGKSRSATIVIAFLMWYRQWSFSDAFKYVQECRSVIEPNLGFCAQLLHYEKELHL